MLARSLTLASLAVLVAVASGCSGAGDDGDGSESQDANLGQVRADWDAAAEKDFSSWVGKIGLARASGKCTSLNACINDPTINQFRAAGDPDMNLFADCADVPMELRAYYAVKTGHPFKYVSEIQAQDPTAVDTRYTPGNHPMAWSTSNSASTMQGLLTRVSDTVHSGFYRMAPEVEDVDTYPIDPSATSLHPGTIFYDPNGHVLIVYRVEADGTVWMMDGHPDNSLTYGPLAEGKFAVGGKTQGGGFRNYRPQRVNKDTGKIEYVPNAELADYGTTQYGHGDQYVSWIRSKISTGPGPTPDKQVKDLLDQLCVDLSARVASVDAAANTYPQPLDPQTTAIPPNIYGADGDWEAYSTPSRDVRLRASVRSIYNLVKQNGTTPAAVTKLGNVWKDHVNSCKVTYTNSAGAPVTITLEDVMTRIYDLSFDPYHCPEMRWGAYKSASREQSTCTNADADHIQRWNDERRNRNVLDRDPSVTATGPDYGPDQPADINVGALLKRLGYR